MGFKSWDDETRTDKFLSRFKEKKMAVKNEMPMRMPEKQAYERICPLKATDVGLCVGSRCMGWRWIGRQDDTKESEGFCGMCPQFPSR